MPKIPDFSKFDLQSIVNSVKSILNPESATPPVAENDSLGKKIEKISLLLQNTAKQQAQSAKDLAQANGLLNALYKDLEEIRQQAVPSQPAPSATPSGPGMAVPKTDVPPSEISSTAARTTGSQEASSIRTSGSESVSTRETAAPSSEGLESTDIPSRDWKKDEKEK